MSNRDAAAWVRAYVEAHPKASTHTIARVATAAGYGLPLEMIQSIRRAANAAPAAPEPTPVIVSAVRCAKCGAEGHWVSQCPSWALPPEPQDLGEALCEAATAPPDDEPAVPLPEVPPAVPEPAMSLLDTMKSHQAAVTALPSPAAEPEDAGRQRTPVGTAVRRAYLNTLLERDPGADPAALVAALRARYGHGLDASYVYATCRVARELHGLPQFREMPEHTRPNSGARAPLPTYGAAEPEEAAPTLEEELQYLARQVAEVMRAQGLTGLSIAATEAEVKLDYEVQRKGSVAVRL